MDGLAAQRGLTGASARPNTRVMTGDQASGTDGVTGWRRLIDMRGPWPWLVYLPLFALPWLGPGPSTPQLICGVVGLAVFLPIYLLGSYMTGRALLASATAVLLISLALAFTGGSWSVVSVYACAMAGQLRPARLATATVIGFAVAMIAFALATQQPWFFWTVGVVLAVMVGLGTVSRITIDDQNRALLAAQDEVRQLSRTAERERIARDLHDLLGRTLTLVSLKAELAARLTSTDPARATAEMRDVAQAARDGLAEVRAAVSGMTGASFARELDQSTEALTAAGIAISTNADGLPEGEPGAVLGMALREAVTNVLRHSEAAHCRIAVMTSGHEARLTVEDDGDGGDGDGSFLEGAGLTGMRARMAAAGGALSVVSGAGGTRLSAWLPAG